MVSSSCHLVVSSRVENIELVQVVLKDALGGLTLDEETRHWIDIAVREAMANAIKHGNQGDPEKTIEVDLGLDDGALTIRIEDQGEGFDPSSVADPLAPENLLRPSGRGIFYMKSFMDAIEYDFSSGQGTTVILRKQLTPSDEEPGETDPTRAEPQEE